MARYLAILFIIILSQSCKDNNSYFVKAVKNGLITVDGKRIESAWSQADSIVLFTNPWNKDELPSTSFFMVNDSINLYFYFLVEDTDIVLEVNYSNERDVEKEDRVELFFSKSKEMDSYYCFEIDPKGRVLSYKAKFYRQFYFEWDPPYGFSVATQIHPYGYSVEGQIPLEFINTIAPDGEIYLGVYRAEFSRQEDNIVENWLTWIDPKTKSPDFHVPASLGRMILYKTNTYQL